MGVYLGREAGGERRGESDGIEVGFENDLKSVEAGLQIDRYRDAIVKLRFRVMDTLRARKDFNRDEHGRSTLWSTPKEADPPYCGDVGLDVGRQDFVRT
ncbi:hypothetical protein Tco_0753726 [Tanacetum coccineum]